MSELIFSFDDDIDMEEGTTNTDHDISRNDTSPHPSSPRSSTSQSGYVMISNREHSRKMEHAPLEAHGPNTSERPHTSRNNQRTRTTEHAPLEAHGPNTSERPHTSRNNQRTRTTASSSDTSSPFPSAPLLDLAAPCNNAQHQECSSSSSHLQPTPQPLISHSPITPESTTPRTRRFQSNMLSMLSLLPPGRYLSPSPSVVEDQQLEHGRDNTQEHDPSAVSPGASGRASAAYAPPQFIMSASYSSSYSIVECPEDLKRS